MLIDEDSDSAFAGYCGWDFPTELSAVHVLVRPLCRTPGWEHLFSSPLRPGEGMRAPMSEVGSSGAGGLLC